MSNFAICFSGHIRTWEKCKQSFIENVLDAVYPIIPDIFVHTYDIANVNSDKYYTQEEVETLMSFTNKFGVEIKPKIVKVVNFKEYMNEISQEAENVEQNSSTCTQRNLATVKKIYLCYQEMKKYGAQNGIKYDRIMVTRYDMLYEKPIYLEELTNDNTLYLHYTGAPDPCDEIAIGFPRAMDIYIARYEQLFKVRYEHTFMGSCPTDCSHLLLKYCCIKFGIGDWGWTNFRTARKCVE